MSTINSTEYPTAYAVRQEMLNWKFLQLNPLELRMPSHIYDPDELVKDGSNLAAVLYRLANENEFALNDISLDMANLVPGILEISVKPSREREEFLIEATTVDGSKFSSRILSDGTLRLLTLVTLRNDPKHVGLLCFEEPENGVHAIRLQQMVDLLKSLATDFSASDADSLPRQVLVNTHSPLLLTCVPPEDLLFVYMPSRTSRETRMAHVIPEMFPYENEQGSYFTLSEIKKYLDPSPYSDKIANIEKALDYSL